MKKELGTNGPFVLTDASSFAFLTMEKVPMHRQITIACESRSLNSAEINVSTIERELMAIVWGVRYLMLND